MTPTRKRRLIAIGLNDTAIDKMRFAPDRVGKVIYRLVRHILQQASGLFQFGLNG